jgi:hypothetical protein
MQQLELWIVDLKPLDREAYGAAGALTNIVTWASDIEGFRRKVEETAKTLDMRVADIEDAEPLSSRTEKWDLTEEVDEMVLRASTNPNAILYGTFHRYPFDDVM